MRLRTAVVTAAVSIAGMFIFTRIMMGQADSWAERVTEISLSERLLAATAFTWSRFWWVGAPAIAGTLLLVSFITTRWET